MKTNYSTQKQGFVHYTRFFFKCLSLPFILGLTLF